MSLDLVFEGSGNKLAPSSCFGAVVGLVGRDFPRRLQDDLYYSVTNLTQPTNQARPYLLSKFDVLLEPARYKGSSVPCQGVKLHVYV